MMAFLCSILISIGDLRLDFCHEVEVTNNVIELTNRAVIKLPKKVAFYEDNALKRIDEVIKVGMPVSISLGYDNNLVNEFSGYVALTPRPLVPFEIYCEDEMWQLKRRTVENKSWTNAKLEDILRHIAPAYKLDALSAEIGKFIIGLKGKETAASVLNRLKGDYGISSFFRYAENGNPVLVSGKPYLWPVNNEAPDYTDAVYCIHGKDCNVKGNALNYQREEEKLVKIIAKLIKPDGKTVTAKFTGDAEGSTTTLHYYNISEKELEENAKADWYKLKKNGYSGTVTGFALPVTRPGMKARIIDQKYEFRDESYFIDQVITRFSPANAIERINKIGYRAND